MSKTNIVSRFKDITKQLFSKILLLITRSRKDQYPEKKHRLIFRHRELIDKEIIMEVYKETTVAILIFDVVLELMAGSLLTGLRDFYKLIPGLFIIIPGLMEMRGNTASSLAQRIGSALHLGLISWEHKFNEEVIENIKASLILATTNSCMLGIGAYAVSALFGFEAISLAGFIILSMGTALIAATTQVFLIVFIALYVHRRGMDPDNWVIPIVTTINDTLVVFYLIFMINVVLFLAQFFPILGG